MIKTERLELVPLTAPQLRQWLYNLPGLEENLCCTYEAEPMKGHLRCIAEQQLRVTEDDPQNYFWHSFWFLIRKSDRKAVGSADFKNLPDVNHAVELGYGLGAAFEHQGYMTEAVQAMCQWALQQKTVKRVTAETELDNAASQHVLQRCGFVEKSRSKTIWWELCTEK